MVQNHGSIGSEAFSSLSLYKTSDFNLFVLSPSFLSHSKYTVTQNTKVLLRERKLRHCGEFLAFKIIETYDLVSIYAFNMDLAHQILMELELILYVNKS